MELDLAGKSVTQAFSVLKQAIEACDDEKLNVRVDNEVVKLNLYNQISKMGYPCKLDRKGVSHFIVIKVGKRKRKSASPPPGPTAFPTGHLSGKKSADASETVAAQKPARPRRTARKTAEQPVQKAPSVEASAPQPSSVGIGWLIIQQDQIGQRDVNLGMDLLEDMVSNLDPQYVTGVFLIHRGVRLLDPNFHEGRLLRALISRNIPISACAKSLAFYHLTENIQAPVNVAPPHEILRLAAKYKLTWI